MGPLARVSFRLNGTAVLGLPGQTILEAASPHFLIPTLCGDPVLPPGGDCGLCVVEVPALGGLVPACSTPLEEGLEVLTFSRDARRARLEALRLIVRGHEGRCLTCGSSRRCRLQTLCQELHLASLGPAALLAGPRPDLRLVGAGPAPWARPRPPAPSPVTLVLAGDAARAAAPASSGRLGFGGPPRFPRTAWTGPLPPNNP